MLKEHVVKVLKEKTPPKELDDLMQRCKELVKSSRNVMKDYYDTWDANEQVYRGERITDSKDKQALKRNEPMKVYVPLTHSQVQTFVSFMVMMLTQRDYMFELSGSGSEDERAAKLAQAVIQRDLEHNKFSGILLTQFATDVAVKGLGIFKTDWVRETVPVAQQVPDPKFQQDPNLPAPVQPPTIEQWTDKTKYLGNRLSVVSPYRWFPDTRLPLTRYREGEFCADENEYSYSQLEKMQRRGEVAGLEEVPRINETAFEDRRCNVLGKDSSMTWDPTLERKGSSQYILITEVELRCNPSKTFIDDGVALDPTLDADVIVLVWIANDSRIIRVEDSGYNHNEFLYDAAQFFNDQSRIINHGIAELLAPMQDILDWLMNSRVTNVRKVVQNQLVVDPRFVEMKDLADRNPIIRLKSIPDGLTIDSCLKQLTITDVTTGHLADMANVSQMSKEATGLQENLLGQYAEGRRSARESSNVNANAAARVTLPIKGLWQGAILPMGRKMLSNTQQGLDLPQLVSVVGLSRVMLDPQAVQSFLPIDRSMLVGNYDFLIFDATLPSQRMAMAAALAQAADTMMKDPRSIFVLGKDPKLLFDEWLELMGVKNADRFNLTPQRFTEIVALAGATGNSGGANVPPGGAGPTANGRPGQSK